MASGCYVFAILARETQLPPGLTGFGGAAVSTVPWRALAAATSPVESGAFRPTGYMERVSKVVEGQPGLSKRAVRESVTGKAITIDLALELLVNEGYIEARHEGQAVRHHSLRAFREAEDD